MSLLLCRVVSFGLEPEGGEDGMISFLKLLSVHCVMGVNSYSIDFFHLHFNDFLEIPSICFLLDLYFTILILTLDLNLTCSCSRGEMFPFPLEMSQCWSVPSRTLMSAPLCLCRV